MRHTPQSIARMLMNRKKYAALRVRAGDGDKDALLRLHNEGMDLKVGPRRKVKAKAKVKVKTKRRRRNHGIVMGPVEEMRNSPAMLPVVEINGRNGEAAEFAEFMASAFKIWKSQ